MRNSTAKRFFDFTGGLNTNSPVTSLEFNQALDLQNINLLPTGGFETRRGNAAFNSTAMNSGANIQALGYYKQGDGDEFLVTFAGAMGFKSEMDGTMDDITGAVTITAAANNIWTFSVMNDLAIFVGGAPNAPIKWNGTGNLAVLAGSPPSGNFGLTHNRRFFIGNTTANPSRIAWSILGNSEDWSGDGSGTQDIQEGDGDTLVTAVPLNTNHLICFKQNSIHDLITTTSPFPVFPLFRDVGCIGKHAKVVVDGTIYFITPKAEMKATDGYKIYDFPDIIDDLWGSISQSRLQYIQGVYNPRLNQIWWICSETSSSTTNDYAIVWDIYRKAWLRHNSGMNMNVFTMTQLGTIYGGSYDGKIYEMDKASTISDASESSAAIVDFWRSGWYDMDTMIQGKYFSYAELNFTGQTAGTFNFGYGYNFAQDRKVIPISMQLPGGKWDQMLWDIGMWGGQSDNTKLVFTKGIGKYFQFLISHSSDVAALKFNGLEIPMKIGSPQALKAG